MAIYRQNGSKYYRIQFVLEGKTYVKSARTTSKKLAHDIERAFREEIIKREKLGIRDRIRFVEAVSLYRESKQNLKSFRTVKGFLRYLEEYFSSTDYLDEITTMQVERMVHERRQQGRAPQTVKYCIVTLCTAN